jgi:outer membrane protein assembly factor BamD
MYTNPQVSYGKRASKVVWSKLVSKSTIAALSLFLVLIMINGCSSNKEVLLSSADAYFAKAMEEYKNENWIEAQKLFDIIKLQYPASQYADDAQFYLAESHFHKGEFILAAFNFSNVRKYYPNSEYCKEALFKTAACYWELSPPYDRDQDYTIKAIQTYSEFQVFYPDDSLTAVAGQKIKDCREKLANREYFTAELYKKLYSPESSIIYYDAVIDDYPDTKFFEPAVVGKAEVLVNLKKNDDAIATIKFYKQKFPNGPSISSINTLEQSIKK